MSDPSQEMSELTLIASSNHFKEGEEPFCDAFCETSCKNKQAEGSISLIHHAEGSQEIKDLAVHAFSLGSVRASVVSVLKFAP